MITLGLRENESGRYSLDTVELYDQDQMKNIRLEGWQVPAEGVVSSFYAKAGDESLPVKISRLIRVDVTEMYKDKENPVTIKAPGFKAEILLGLKEPDPDTIISFGLEGGWLYFAVPYKELKSYQATPKKRVNYFFDSVDTREGTIYLDGWTFVDILPAGSHDVTYEEVEITARNKAQSDGKQSDRNKQSDGKQPDRNKQSDGSRQSGSNSGSAGTTPAEIKVTKKRRLDVLHVKHEGDSKLKVGFHIELPEDTDELLFTSEDGQAQAVIDLASMTYAEREKHRKYKSLLDMMLHSDQQTKLDDRKYKQTHTFKEYRELVKTRIGKGKPSGYMKYMLDHSPNRKEIARQQQEANKFAFRPLISIIVPVYKTPEAFLRDMIDSVRAQTYSNWQLCIADGSADPRDRHTAEVLKKYSDGDKRIVWKELDENLGISGNTNAALELAEGDFISLLDHDDTLAPDALFEVVKALQDPEADAVYTDEDKVTMDLSLYFNPNFKPDFNLDLLRSCNYICHLFTVRRTIAREAGGFHTRYDGSQDFDFILRCAEKSRKVLHVQKALYHWRSSPNSTATNPESKLYCYNAGKLAVEDHLQRQGIEADVNLFETLGYYDVKYKIKKHPRVSVIIPTMDHADVLDRCVRSILDRTDYPDYQIILVENNSKEQATFDYYDQISQDLRVKVVKWEREFNYSAINNFGATFADGDLLLFLNNDTEVISPDWMERLAGDCSREEAGIAGARLLFPDGTIQSAGIRVDGKNIAVGLFEGTPSADTGYQGRAAAKQDLSAVTGACLMIKADLFRKVGGFEELLAVDYNDVDLCLKVRELDKLVVFDPQAELLHYESLSRREHDTPEKRKQFKEETDYMRKRWARVLEGGDPYYNPNLSLESNCYAVKE